VAKHQEHTCSDAKTLAELNCYYNKGFDRLTNSENASKAILKMKAFNFKYNNENHLILTIKDIKSVYEIEFNILLLMYLKYITLRLQNTTIIDMNSNKVVFLLYFGRNKPSRVLQTVYQKIAKTFIMNLQI
jgi:hypothetical protein